MSQWGVEPTPSEYRIGLNVSENLIEKEPPNSYLRKLHAEHQARLDKDPMGKKRGTRSRADAILCNSLRKASYEALSRLGGRTIKAKRSGVSR